MAFDSKHAINHAIKYLTEAAQKRAAGGWIPPKEQAKQEQAQQKQLIADKKEREKNLAAFQKGNHPEVPHVAYHGTTGDFSEFLNRMSGSSTGAKSAKLGHWFTDNPDVARTYADYSATNAPIDRLMAAAAQAEKAKNWDLHNKIMDEAEKLDVGFSYNPETRKRGQNIIPAHLSMKNPYVIDANGENYASIEGGLTKQIQLAKLKGHDGVIVKNLDDAAGLSDVPANHYIVFNPTQIKSATGNSGHFDPSNPDITKSEGGQILSKQFPTHYMPEVGRQVMASGGEIDHKELQKAAHEGRNGDTMLAHINPQEAALLKRMGGSGTINPETGLPEFSGADPSGSSVTSSNYGGGSLASGTNAASEANATTGGGGGGNGGGGGGGGTPSVTSSGGGGGGGGGGSSASPQQVMPGFGGAGAGTPAQPAASGRPAGATEGEMVGSEPGIGIGQNIGASYLQEALTPDLSGGSDVMSPQNLGIQNGVLMGGMTPGAYGRTQSQAQMLQGMGISGGPTTTADLNAAAQAARMGDVPGMAQAEAAPKADAVNPLSTSDTSSAQWGNLGKPWAQVATDVANWIGAGFKTPELPPATVTQAAPTPPKEQGQAPGSPSSSLYGAPNAGDLYAASNAPLAVGQFTAQAPAPSPAPQMQLNDTRDDAAAQAARDAWLAQNYPESPRLGDLAQPTPAAPFAVQNRAGSMGSMPMGTQQYSSDLTPMSSQPAFPHTPTPFSGYPQDVQNAMIPQRPDSAFRTGKQIDPAGAQTKQALENLELAKTGVTMLNAPGIAGGLVRMFTPTPTPATPEQQAAIERMYRGTLESGVPEDFATQTQMLRDYGYPTGTTPQRAGSAGTMPSDTTKYGSDLTPAYTDSGQRAGSIGSMPQSSVGQGSPVEAYDRSASTSASDVRSNFNQAFAEARARGDQTFTWTNPLTGKTMIYTTQLARKDGGRVPSLDNPEDWLAHVKVDTPKGKKREHHGAKPLPVDYGHIAGTKGADGMDVDAFVGPNKKSDKAFVINQQHPETKKFDEHKIMLGFDSKAQALDAYRKSYPAGLADRMAKNIISVPAKKAIAWAKSGKTSQPADRNTIVKRALMLSSKKS